MSQFRPARKRVNVSVGESVRIIRELQGLSQNQLAERTRIPQATLSAIENDRVRLGVERAKVIARARHQGGRGRSRWPKAWPEESGCDRPAGSG